MVDQVFGAIAPKEVLRHGQIYHFPCGAGKVAGTAGWTFVNDNATAVLPASETNSTLVIPISLKQGWVITSFRVTGQLESGGNTATLDADLRETSYGTSAIVNTSIGAITQVSKTADYQVDETKTGLTHTVEVGQSVFVILTGTTAAATDLDMVGIEVTVTEY